MDTLESLTERYEIVGFQLSEMTKQKTGNPYHDLRIDDEMNVLRNERYDIHTEILNLYPVMRSLLIDYSVLNLLVAIDIYQICKKELTYNAKDILGKKYQEFYPKDISDIVDKIYYSQF